jgi:hypothetical protein
MTSPRFLRISFSALSVLATILCLVAAVFTTALWVRSYRAMDTIYVRNRMGITSNEGALVLSNKRINLESWYSHHVAATFSPHYQDDFGNLPSNRWFTRLRWNSGLRVVYVPMWFLAGTCWMAVALLSVRRRYGLRVLFLWFTVVAVALGVAVWWIGTPVIPPSAPGGF